MKAFGTRMRGGIAAALSAALIMGGALLAAPAAYAEEPVAEVVATDAPATEVPAAEAPTEEATAEEPAVAPTADAPAEAAPEAEAAPAETAAQASVTVTPQAVAAAPALVSTEAPRAGGEITVTGSGFAAAYPGVYIGIAPAGYTGFYAGASGLLDTVHVATTNEEGTSSSGRTAKLNDDGSFSVKFTVPAFEEGKPYSLYVAKAHGQGMADTSQNVIADIAYEAPAPTTEGTATVIAADASGITVRGALTNVSVIANPNGVHVGVVLRGTTIGSTSSDFRGATASVTSIPSDGSISADVVIPAAQLDATQEYELVVWPRRTNPTAENVVKVLEFDVTAEQWDAVFPPAAPVPALTAEVTETAGTGISVAVAGSGFDDVKALPGQPAPSVYVALVEKGGSLALEQSDAIAVNIAEGKFTGTVTAAAAKLDRAKSYELISWPSRSNPSESNILARTDAVVDWDALFPPVVPTPAGVVSVTAASEAGLTLSAALTGLDAAGLQNGVYVGLIEAGTAETATTSSIIGTQWVRSIAASGEVTQEVTALQASLDRAKSYEVLVWRGHTNPSAATNVLVLPVSVTAGQWDAVFPPVVPAGPSITADVTENAETSIDVAVSGTGFEDVKALPGQTSPHVYVALVEKNGGFALEQSDAISAEVVDGKISGTLTVLAAKLDRAKQYEIITWPSRSNPSEENIYARTDAVINWNKLFPTPPAEGTANVVAASTEGITVRGSLTKVNAAANPNGVHVGVVVRGTAIGATEGSFLGETVSIATVPANGSIAADVKIPKAQLDRSTQYELVVWPQRTNPTASNVVKVLSFDVSAAEWSAVFPPAVTTPGAGSLTWGVSTEFNDYIMGSIAKGKVSPSGVGGGRGGYVFPQATSSSWNAATRTGSVQYRGSVNYWGHGGLIDMTFANPVITVTSPISGTISSGGQTFSLSLGSAGFTQNADGSVTFSNVGVNGSISGGDGGGSGGTVVMDPLSFTVGSVSGLNFGSSSTTSPFAQTRTAAATPPSTTGLTVVTAADKLVAGSEIEITASGFQPNEQGILVVLYSDPTVLDTNAKADKNGVVRWIGKLPKDISGKHTITLQGSINVGHEITIAKADAEKKVKSAVASQSTTSEAAQSNGGELSQSGAPAWVWWAGALALLVVAGASTGLVVAQRRKSDTPTHL